MDTDRDLSEAATLALDSQPEEEKAKLEPSPEYAETTENLIETCKDLTGQIQDTLLELKALLNGNLDTLLVHEPITKTHGNREIRNQDGSKKMENLKKLLDDGDETEQEKTRHFMDSVIIRSKISGTIKTILVNMFSGYKEAVETLIENLNTLLREFAKTYEQLRDSHAKQMTEIAKVNLNRYRASVIPQISQPELPKDIRKLPDSVNPNLITPKILEENLSRHYDTTSSDQPPRQHQLPE